MLSPFTTAASEAQCPRIVPLLEANAFLLLELGRDGVPTAGAEMRIPANFLRRISHLGGSLVLSETAGF